MSYLDATAAYFREHPNTRISCYDLAKVGGANGWRTRVGECRNLLGMNIPKNPLKVKDPITGVVTTYYIYYPKDLLELAS